MTRAFAIFAYGLILAFFAVFFLMPLAYILRGGFMETDGTFTLAYVLHVFENPVYLVGLRNAFGLGIASTTLTVAIAVPLAWVGDRYAFPGKRMLGALVLLPIMLPPFVGAIGLQQIFGQYGALNALLLELGLFAEGMPPDWFGQNRFWGIALLNALGLYPILYLNVLASLGNVDPAMEEAAENLGCRGPREFFRITLPLIMPGLFAGGTVVFIWSFTELGVPLIFNYERVTPVQIFNGLKELGANPFPYALVAVMLVFSVASYALGKGLFGRKSYAMLARASHVREPRRPGWLGAALCTGLLGGASPAALLPHLAVAGIAFSADWYATALPDGWTLRNFEAALAHPLVAASIGNSLVYSVLAVALNILLGVGIAYLVVRSRLPGRGLLDNLAMLPLAVPGLVMAFGYLAVSQEGRPLALLNPVDNPTVLLAIAYGVRKMPLMVRAAVAGLQQTSEEYELAARNLGAPPWRAALLITLPLVVANLLAGAVLVFSQSMLEVSDSLILAIKQEHYPITKAIFELLSLLGEGPFVACALGVWAMTFLAATIIAANALLGRRLGAVFRF